MTRRFPLGCRSRYPNPYQFINFEYNNNKLCFSFRLTNCSNSEEVSPKCQIVQQNIRKIMIASKQDPIRCQAIQLQTRSLDTSSTPLNVSLTTKTGRNILGMYDYWFHHSVSGNTQTALEVLKAQKFADQNDPNIEGYTLCIYGVLWRHCLLNNNNTLRISTFDVSDHSCDPSQFIRLEDESSLPPPSLPITPPPPKSPSSIRSPSPSPPPRRSPPPKRSPPPLRSPPSPPNCIWVCQNETLT